jgi:hypothetical protein
MLAPFVRMLQNLRIARAAVPIVAVVAFAVIFSLGRVLAIQVTDLASNLPKRSFHYRGA